MSVSHVPPNSLTLPAVAGWWIVPAGLLAIFATYWDESWHTDVGRDTAWAPPHVLLYGAVAVAGLGVAAWGVRVWWRTRSLRVVLRQRALVAAGAGGIAVLAAAPIDALWHERYGRDSVLWSPPHMLVVLGASGLTIGVLTGLPPASRTLRALACVLLAGNALAVVFEYEADVPQFDEVLYLPILLAVGGLVAWIARHALPVRAPVSTAVLGYAALRLGIMVALALLGRSTPDLPVAVVGLALVDLPLRAVHQRYAAGLASTAALAWLASLAGLASPAPAAVAVTALPVIIASALVILLSGGAPRTRWLLPGAVATVALGLLMAGPAEPAAAHDPGQGRRVSDVELTVASDGSGELTVRVHDADGCAHLTPVRVVGRRAGDVAEGRLRMTGGCTYVGELDVKARGRWFVYAELSLHGERVETWLPVQADEAETITRERELYVPATTSVDGRTDAIVLGALLYLAGAALVLGGVLAVRRPFALGDGA